MLCDRIRCLFGNPFRPVVLSPALSKWNDGVLRQLATAIYEGAETGFYTLSR